jgi:2-polyprenyl-6-methoxyphenol hydroxylase-like FAD-dependent oxidoreductase
MAEVLVVGAGPVGLTMAAELARHGTRCRIIDRLAAPSPYCRAIGVTPRTLEVWDDMGIAREMIDAGLWLEGRRSIIQGHAADDAVLDLSDLPYAQLGLPQYETERVLTQHLARFGIAVERGVGLAGLSQDAHAVTVRLDHADGRASAGSDGFEALADLGDVAAGLKRRTGVRLRIVAVTAAASPRKNQSRPLERRRRQN